MDYKEKEKKKRRKEEKLVGGYQVKLVGYEYCLLYQDDG